MSPHRVGDAPEDLVDRRRYRLNYVAANSFEFFIALAATLAGLAFLLAPDSLENSAVADAAGPMTVLWAFMYINGALLVLLGLLRPSVRAEVAGLLLLAPAALIDAIALAATRGQPGWRYVIVNTAFAVATGLRIWYVLRVSRAQRR